MLDSRTRPNQLLRLGFVADGCFKLVVAAGLPAVASRIGSSPGLGLTASIAVAASAAREIDVGVRSGSSCRPRYLAAYDSGWLAATAVAVALARRRPSHAGRVWLGYQTVASITLTRVLGAGRRRGSPSGRARP